jgi:cytochrome c peroxidase
LPESIPAPQDNPTTPEKVELGKQLFFDPRLSGDNTKSCATCHIPDKAFTDGLPQAEGPNGKKLSRNTPTLLNVGLYESYFWDGRASSLEEQALAPIESPDELNQKLDELEEELNAVPGYVQQFQSVFGTRVTRVGIGQAIAAFQRPLITQPAPLDRYLAGEKDALSPQAIRGMELFLGDAGCVRCHQGQLLSDGKFYRLGISSTDFGRSEWTKSEDDRGKFRTPSLRNVAETAPYMHDGSKASLDDVVEFYYREVPISSGGLPVDVAPLVSQSYSEIPLIVAFLEGLTGESPRIEPPELP